VRDNSSKKLFRRALLGASALIVLASAAPALGEGAIRTPDIVVRDDLNPDAGPNGALDPVDINGIGEMTIDVGGGFVGLCTGTLINPRTVIFAAHCVNESAAGDYGAKTGGIPISFGFHQDNLPAIIDWLGFGDNPALQYKTSIANALYNVEQVWYDPRSTRLGEGLGFLEADVALATLDTPTQDIPTWTLLFSPLNGPTHATVTGYGNYGNGTVGDVDLDFRRRVAENVVSFLGSLNDVDDVLFGENGGLPQTLYQTDFDDPKFGTPAANPFDFDVFGGAALAREGSTAPGDSGGPLIIDQQFAIPVVAGVLSGGSRFFLEQPPSGYGSTSFYQPLFLFWQDIVRNNPYRYAGNKAGIGDWTDPSHWVQQMDPAYAVIRNGKLVNALPTVLGQGVSGDTYKFGQVCDGVTCTPVQSQGTASNYSGGSGLVLPGGPGSTNFVPDNVVADPVRGIMARYYDVTLAAAGITTLGKSVTIDKLTVNGATILDVKKTGRLNVLTDFTQGVGWTNVDGTLKAGESLLVGGLLTGSGTFDPTYLTSIRGTIAPGGLLSVGTLTVLGDVILSSGNSLYIDLTQGGGDRLAVRADADNPGRLRVDGTVLVTPGAGTRPRYGQVFDIATAEGGVSGRFANVYSLLPGVLRADLRYSANAVDAVISAGSLADLLKSLVGTAAEAIKFATALDALRGQNYSKLSSVYGSVDLLAGEQLAASLRGLAPTKTDGYARRALDRQRSAAIRLVSDRLSDLGGRRAQGLSLIGSPGTLMRAAAQVSTQSIGDRPGQLGLGFAQAPRTMARLPDGMSGFVAARYMVDAGAGAVASPRFDGERSWQVAMGLEQEVAAGTTLGLATSFGGGGTGLRQSLTYARDDVRQASVYGTQRIGQRGYVGALASAMLAGSTGRRRLALGDAAFDLRGEPTLSSFAMAVESGVRFPIGPALTLTPRAGLRYSLTHSSRYRESGGDAALLVEGSDYAQAETRMGAKLDGSHKLGNGWAFVPRIQFDWVHNLTGRGADLRTRFAAADDYLIELAGVARARNWGELRGGFEITDGTFAFGLTADGSTARSEVGDNRALASFAWRF